MFIDAIIFCIIIWRILLSICSCALYPFVRMRTCLIIVICAHQLGGRDSYIGVREVFPGDLIVNITVLLVRALNTVLIFACVLTYHQSKIILASQLIVAAAGREGRNSAVRNLGSVAYGIKNCSKNSCILHLGSHSIIM